MDSTISKMEGIEYMDDSKNELELLKKILDTLPSSIYFKDCQGRYVWLNKMAIEQVSYKHLIIDSIIGKTDLEVFPKESALEYMKNDKKIMDTQQGDSIEEDVMLPNGKILIQLSFKEPFYDDSSQLIGILGYTIDITEKKATEKREKEALIESSLAKAKANAEEQLRQAVMILTGGIAHDLRTPISMIEMDADFLKKYLPTLLNAYVEAKAHNIPFEEDNIISDRVKKHLFELNGEFKETTQEMHDFIDTTLKTLSKVVSGHLENDDLVACSMWHCIHHQNEGVI